jgi:hypothetical protein
MMTKPLTRVFSLDIQRSPRLTGEKRLSWVTSVIQVAGVRVRSTAIRIFGIMVFLEREDIITGGCLDEVAKGTGHSADT